MEQIILYSTNLLAFVFVLTILVGIHEYAHYWVAKKMGVKIEIFSIGIGKILYSYIDKHGTKWCISMLPVGGYVKMFGDKDISSSQINSQNELSDEDKAYSFVHKSPLKRLAIVIAGPISNYILAFFIFFIVYFTFGIQEIAPIITHIEKKSPADIAGLQENDVILSINQNKVSNFFDAKILIQTSKSPINIEIKRGSEITYHNITPDIRETKDFTGKMRKTKIIGIAANKFIEKKLSLFEAVKYSLHELYFNTKMVFLSITGLFTGSVSVDDMSGIATIAEISGAVARVSFISLFLFIASFSVNLAALNFLPIPVLDGGHILFYTYECIFKKPINIKIQNLAYKLGAFIVIGFMLWVNIIDILRIF